jgi:hypothetical protein
VGKSLLHVIKHPGMAQLVVVAPATFKDDLLLNLVLS